MNETTADTRIALAIGLTARALDRTRSQAERDELTAEALELLAGIATD